MRNDVLICKRQALDGPCIWPIPSKSKHDNGGKEGAREWRLDSKHTPTHPCPTSPFPFTIPFKPSQLSQARPAMKRYIDSTFLAVWTEGVYIIPILADRGEGVAPDQLVQAAPY